MTGERDYSEMTAPELNAELRALYELLPRFYYALDDKELEIEDIELVRGIRPDIIRDFENPKIGEEDISVVSELSEEVIKEMKKIAAQRTIKSVARIHRRKNSELLSLSGDRFSNLISFSHLLPSLQQFSAHEFNNVSMRGRGENPEEDGSIWLLEMDDETGGVFNPVRAKRVNRRLIYFLQDEQRSHGETADHLSELLGSSQVDFAERAVQEFIEKYGDEP